MRQKLEKKWEE